MSVEVIDVTERAAVFAALGDPVRLQIVERLATSDATPSELAEALDLPSNLLAHHLSVLTAAGLVLRSRSEGDRRRFYCRLLPDRIPRLATTSPDAATRLLFVCTANSARSHLAAALWRQASALPVASAGTSPAQRVDPRALAAAKRHRLPLPRSRPQALETVVDAGDVIVTVCDLARESLGDRVSIHWSIPDPVRVGTDTAFDAVVAELHARVERLAPHLAA